MLEKKAVEKKMVNFVPRNKRILVDQPEAQKKIGALHVPDQFQFKPNVGTVIAIDPSIDQFKVGDQILFHKGAGFVLNINQKEYLMIHELEIFMSYEEK